MSPVIVRTRARAQISSVETWDSTELAGPVRLDLLPRPLLSAAERGAAQNRRPGAPDRIPPIQCRSVLRLRYPSNRPSKLQLAPANQYRVGLVKLARDSVPKEQRHRARNQLETLIRNRSSRDSERSQSASRPTPLPFPLVRGDD
jgi:hypothetical protein